QNNYLVNNVDKSVWISFVANESAIQIYTYELAANPGTVVNEMYVYSGACGSTSLVSSKVFDYSNYGVRTLYLNGLNTGSIYFVKLISAATNSNIAVSFTRIFPTPSVAPCAAPAPNYSLGTQIMPTIIPGSTISVAAGCTLTIGPGSTQQLISNCKMVMGIGSKIIAPNGIKITNGTRIYSCTGMWQGIDVLSGDLVIDQNSMISDADRAVNIFGGYAIIQDAIFNRNRHSVVYNTSINSSTPVIPIRNTIFTSRDFFLTYTLPNPTLTFLKSINSSTGQSYLEGYPLVGLQNTNLPRAYSGIEDFHVYNTPLVIGQFPVSSKDNNIFENLDFGIISRTTRTTCVNNVFRFMPRTTNSSAFPYSTPGIGILADGGTSPVANSYHLKVGDLTPSAAQNTNVFFNCGEGIFSNNYSTNTIRYNNFTTDNLNLFPLYFRGLEILPANGGSTIFEYNTVSDIYTGMRVLAPVNFTFSTFSISHNSFSSGKLLIGASLLGGWGILLNTLTGSSTLNSAKINDNTISNVSSGIRLIAGGANTEIIGNSISLLSYPILSTPSVYTGIYIESSNGSQVKENIIVGDYTSGAASLYSCGIYTLTSYNCRVHCNSVSNVRQGFIFEGNCTSTADQVFRYNALSNTRDGLVLLNSGAIGPIGNTLNPGGNTWAGFFDNSRSLADMSNFNFGNPFQSYFYCKPGSGTTPPPLTNKVAAGTQASNKLSPMLASGPDLAFCGGSGGGGGSAMAAINPIDVLTDRIADATAYPVLEEENEWANKKSAYETLTFDPSFDSIIDPNLSTFVNEVETENIATIAWTDELLKQQDLYLANYLNNGLSPENLMEQNYKTLTKYSILWNENPEREFSITEISDLYSVANQCSNLGGKAVVQAQLFLDYILHQEGSWNSNCPLPASALRKAMLKNKEQRTETKLEDENKRIEISPNPAKEQIAIKNIYDDELINYEIVDLLGNQVLAGFIGNSNNIVDISNLKNGIYFINFIHNNSIITNNKIIISN
ncbi:MAG: T9SS type A sorting domain-containing protein, partial [Bacteroidia bacterium]|nr:T9SS type A sorting domain-containing protein [Bacteroidia bacterium]